jgi:VanZ family protein
MLTREVWDRLLAVMCGIVLACILTAGLWPFTPYPKNEVAWRPNASGLHFGEYGTILSAGAVQVADLSGGASCSLEIWFKPGLINDSNNMLAVYSPENLISFSLRQNSSDLFIQRREQDRPDHVSEVHTYLDNVLRPNMAPLLTMAAGPQGASFYVDGVLVKAASEFTASIRNFAGRLIVANSPVANDSWSGDLFGLAIYDRELSAAEVLEHSNSWRKNGRPATPGKGDPVALYLFDEGMGNVVHNRAGSAPDLNIPDHYLVLHKPLLEAPWKEYYPSWDYVQDVLINIIGFIPLGFVFSAYLSSVRHAKRALWVTILLGFMVSLTIEVLQAFMPTRDSGMTDLITNTLGTAIGTMLFQWKITQAIFSRIGIPIRD